MRFLAISFDLDIKHTLCVKAKYKQGICSAYTDNQDDGFIAVKFHKAMK